MRYIFITILSIFLTFAFNNISFGQTKSTTPTSAVTQQQIDELKSKIASKVAELKLVEKRGVIGKVTDSSDTQITLTNVNGDIRNIDVDELTKFYSTDKTFGISDVKVGQTLGILGLYNKDSRRILAREINVIPTLPTITLGKIYNIDKINYEVTIKQNDRNFIFEIQDYTKTYTYTDDVLTKSGFSKMQSGIFALAIGDIDKELPTKFLASKIVNLPNILSVDTNSKDINTITATPSGSNTK